MYAAGTIGPTQRLWRAVRTQWYVEEPDGSMRVSRAAFDRDGTSVFVADGTDLEVLAKEFDGIVAEITVTDVQQAGGTLEDETADPPLDAYPHLVIRWPETLTGSRRKAGALLLARRSKVYDLRCPEK